MGVSKDLSLQKLNIGLSILFISDKEGLPLLEIPMLHYLCKQV